MIFCSRTYAYKKLEEKCGNEIGCYLLRESESTYDEYYVDLFISTETPDCDKIYTFKIYNDETGFYYLEDGSAGFPSVSQLLSYHSKEIQINFSRCIPPSEYGKTYFFSLLYCCL